MKSNSSSRIHAFDLLRGWCLVVISSDHLERFPSVFDPFTGRGLLWVSAAEGFFFISGALVGIVRGRSMAKNGLKAATKELWSRAAKLYAASVILTLGFTLVSYFLSSIGLHMVKGGLEYFGSGYELIWRVLTLQYSYGWTDFLNYYVVYLLLSPLVLWLCQRKLWWTVLLLSLGLWVLKLDIRNDFVEAYLTWQVYFFSGLVFGYYYSSIHAWYRSLRAAVRRNGRASMFGLTLVTVLASFAFTFGTPIFENRNAELHGFFDFVKDNSLFNVLLQNNRTGLLRLPLFLLWFGTIFAILRKYETAALRRLGWLLLPLGKNSLYVYIVQGIVVFLITLLNIPGGFMVNTLLNVFAVVIYWVAVRQRILFSVIPR